MRDREIIWTGLAVFLLLATFPLWRNLAVGANPKGPGILLPKAEKQCVAPVAYMKTSHMRLLLDLRENVVRRNARTFRAGDGRQYTMSLTGTCLEQCHTAKADFCDKCHNYAAVSVTCFNCHVDRKPVLWSAR